MAGKSDTSAIYRVSGVVLGAVCLVSRQSSVVGTEYRALSTEN